MSSLRLLHDSEHEGSRDAPVLVTGGAGFVGTHLLPRIVEGAGCPVVSVGRLARDAGSAGGDRPGGRDGVRRDEADVRDGPTLRRLFERHGPSAVLHLAAETEGERSLEAPLAFVHTNVLGTCTLLAEATRYYESLEGARRREFRFVHVSTDRAFGDLGPRGFITESSPYDATSPYAASKAAADHFVRVWGRAYGLPVLLVVGASLYGPYEPPARPIPSMILRALARRPVPVHGDGRTVRDWLYVEDFVEALLAVWRHGRPSETYCVGGGEEHQEIEVATRVCDALDELRPRGDGRSFRSQIAFVPDRRRSDRRSAIDASKIRWELGWGPVESFGTGLRRTVSWYLENEPWWVRVGQREAAADSSRTSPA